jgi:transposase
MQTRSFIGLDIHKDTISVSIAEDGRDGAVRFVGVIPNTPNEIAKIAKRLSRHGELDFCYEAGGCGYGIYRQLTELGHQCTVVATSMIPRKPGERIKTDRRDSQKLAILHRSGDLTAVWVPDPTHEALRDLVRARIDASMHLMRARQQLLAFLFRHGRTYSTGKYWTQRHRSWLAGQTFELHGPSDRLSGLCGSSLDCTGEKRRSDRKNHGDDSLLVVGAAGRSVTQPARHRSGFCGNSCRDDWRSEPFRVATPVDGVLGPGSFRALQRRSRPARRHYQDG